MMIKSQDKIMSAIKKMLEAETAHVLYTAPIYSKRKVSAKTLKDRRAAVLTHKTILLDNLESARAELRRTYTEVVRDEYGQ